MRPPSLWQILIIVLIIVIIFGAKRLPDVASSIGKSLKIFKKEVTELREDDDAPATGSTTTSGQHTATGSTHANRATDEPGTPPAGGTGGTDTR